ncbi:hypothetical protein SFC65_19900 [Priestia filamentosa]
MKFNGKPIKGEKSKEILKELKEDNHSKEKKNFLKKALKTSKSYKEK